MKNWLSNLFRPEPASPAPDAGEDLRQVILDLQKENQSLRMDCETRDESIAGYKLEVERLRLRQDELAAQTTAARMESLLGELAGPASQMLTQADLLENQGQPVQARDVLAVAKRVIRALERHGLVFEGHIGQQEAFDPNRHIVINSTAGAPAAGCPVTVRFAGASYHGKIVHKAVVEQVGECPDA